MLFDANDFSFDSDSFDTDKVNAIGNLLTVYGLGKHIVLISSYNLKCIMKSNLFGEIIKIYASNLLDQIREYDNLKNIIDLVFEIDFKNKDISEIYYENDTRTTKIGYGNFLDIFKISEPEILGENREDSKFFEIIGRTYVSSDRNISNLELSLKLGHGGGSTTYTEFLSKRDKKNFCLCYVDNDKKHPLGPIGDTAKRFKVNDIKPDCFTEAIILKIHELECLLPINSIDEVFNNTDTSQSMKDSLKYLKQIQDKDIRFRHYYDHKAGLSIKKAKKLDELYGDFWLTTVKDLHSVVNDCKICCLDGNCNNESTCKSLNGFGDKILNKTITLLKDRPYNLISVDLCEAIKPIWYDIGKKVFSWGCSPSRRVVS